MIPFRTQRLATSVVNRILNLRTEFVAEPRPASGLPAAPEPTPMPQPSTEPVSADPQVAQDVALSEL